MLTLFRFNANLAERMASLRGVDRSTPIVIRRRGGDLGCNHKMLWASLIGEPKQCLERAERPGREGT
jgi:hypothetical protein